MNLYRTTAGNWTGTQADAKRIAREDGSHGKFDPIDVPTTKAELIEFLNERELAVHRLPNDRPLPPSILTEPQPPLGENRTISIEPDLELQILEASGVRFGRLLAAALERAAELGATTTRDALAHDLRVHKSRGAFRRGLLHVLAVVSLSETVDA